MIELCQFGKNQAIGVGDRVKKMSFHRTIIMILVIWKIS